MKLPKLVSEIDEFFRLDNNPNGSFERVVEVKGFLEKRGNFNHLIAGSWAIEAISNQEIEHDDIDLIILDNSCFYVDDAITKEEHCCNIIPLPTNYIKENAVKVKLRGK